MILKCCLKFCGSKPGLAIARSSRLPIPTIALGIAKPGVYGRIGKPDLKLDFMI